jgi:hypothetical protein
MSRARWSAVVGVVVVTVVALAWFTRDQRTGAGVEAPGQSIAAVLSSSPASTATPSPTPSATSSPTPLPTATATPRPTPTDRAPAGDPRLLYAEFLLRLGDDRSTVAALNQTLQDAAEAGDHTAVRRAAIEILDFADAEHDWLRDHPPAACYADAHASADKMLDAYAAAADAFIAWADAGDGLDGLAAFGRALEAAGAAGDAATALGRELEATTCLS